jgi:hypothetical protein
MGDRENFTGVRTMLLRWHPRLSLRYRVMTGLFSMSVGLATAFLAKWCGS